VELKQIIEAIVFSAQKPMSIGELRALLRDTPEKLPDDAELTAPFAKATARAVEKALEELALEHDNANRSYRLACVGGNWQFVTRPEYAPWLQVLVGAKPRPPKLSNPALETLAIIAYRQPITRSEMEQIRGVAVDGVVQTLIERELIEVRGEADAPGRPRLYGTTTFFLEHFGLKGLEELPAAEELRRIQLELATVPDDDSQEQLPLDNEAAEDDDEQDDEDSEEDEDDDDDDE
jgi:segregation and condensation protein B